MPQSAEPQITPVATHIPAVRPSPMEVAEIVSVAGPGEPPASAHPNRTNGRGRRKNSATGLYHQPAHLSDGRLKPDEDGLANQKMSDVQLNNLRERRNRGNTLIG